MTTKQPCNAALYMRLSRDDEKFGDSVSIETQRTLLNQFAAENNLHVSGEYIDDGWSGTNFERPNFKRMMKDVESGKINCVIVKDLSRFGREHIMMGYFLEFIFPKNKTRFIAVSEGEDSDKGLSDFVPLKNYFNEWFAKDTSRKVKSALRAKHNAGERTFTYAPLGYLRDPENHNNLIVDEETRWIIEHIFGFAFRGAGAAKITKTLIEEKVPTARWLNYSRYESSLKIKYTRDAESAQMIDLIHDGLGNSFALAWHQPLNTFLQSLIHAAVMAENTFASKYASMEATLQDKLTTLIDTYKSNNE